MSATFLSLDGDGIVGTFKVWQSKIIHAYIRSSSYVEGLRVSKIKIATHKPSTAEGFYVLSSLKYLRHGRHLFRGRRVCRGEARLRAVDTATMEIEMSIQFLGRASGGGVEELQEPFKVWLTGALEESAPGGNFIVVLKVFVQYNQPMPRIRVIEPDLSPRDIVIEVFPVEVATGLSYSLYLPDEIDRAELATKLRNNVASFR